MTTLTIVIPIYNEKASLEILIQRIHQVLCDAMNVQDISYNILFVDDGSNDGTHEILQILSSRYSSVGFIRFARNFGHQAAILAGMKHCTSDLVITMDGDLEHPPEHIPKMIQLWREGNLVIQAVKSEQSDLTFFKKFTANVFYKLFGLISQVNLAPGSSDFRLLTKEVIDALRPLKEPNLFLRGIIPWLGFKTAYFSYESQKRVHGVSKYTLRKMIQLARSGIVSFSALPLRLAVVFGMISMIFSLCYGCYALYIKFFTTQAITGWTSLVFLISLFHGVQFFLLGIIGEYIANIHERVKERPEYIIIQSCDPNWFDISKQSYLNHHLKNIESENR